MSGLSCSTWGLSLQHMDSLLVAHGLSCSVVCGILTPARDWTCVPCTARWIFNHWTTREVCLPQPQKTFLRSVGSGTRIPLFPGTESRTVSKAQLCTLALQPSSPPVGISEQTPLPTTHPPPSPPAAAPCSISWLSKRPEGSLAESLLTSSFQMHPHGGRGESWGSRV